MNLRIVYGGSGDRTCEIRADKSQSVDEIKYLVDELFHSNDFYTNVSIDTICKNCILDDKKPISYYKIEENDEIWIGKIEDYLRDKDVIVNVFVIGEESELIYIIGKKNETVSEIIGRVKKICLDISYVNIWDAEGNCLQMVNEISKIGCIRGEIRLIISLRKEMSYSFEKCCRIHDQYIMEKYLWRFNWDVFNLCKDNWHFTYKTSSIDNSVWIDMLTDLRLNIDLSTMGSSFLNSNFLFCMRISERIFDACRDNIRWNINKWNQESYDEMIDYFIMAICAALIDHQNLRRFLTNQSDRGVVDIVTDAINYLIHSSYSKGFVAKIFGFWNCFLLIPLTYEDMENVVDDMHHKYWFINMELFGGIHSIKFHQEFDSTKQIKKNVSIQSGALFQRLSLVDASFHKSLENEEFPNLLDGKYFIRNETEKIKLKVIGNRSYGVNCEVVVDKGHRVDEIKYLVDEVLNTNDLYTNVSIDMIYKNCILNERKTISYYNIESNEEIWIGKIEDYLKQLDIIMNVFLAGIEPEMIHIIMKRSDTIGGVLLAIQQVCVCNNYISVWDTNGNELMNDQRIEELYSSQEEYKIIINMNDRCFKNNLTFERCCRIHDQYLIHEYFNGFYIESESESLDSINLSYSFLDEDLEEEMNSFISLLQSSASNDQNFHQKLSELSKPFFNSKFLFSKKIVGQILYILGDYLRLTVEKYEWETFSDLIEYFNIALFASVTSYLNREESDGNGCDKSLMDIVNDAKHLLTDNNLKWAGLIECFGKGFLVKIFDCDDLEKVIFKRQYWTIRLRTSGHVCEIRMARDIKGVKQIKKIISMKTGVHFEDLHVMECEWEEEARNDEVLDVIQGTDHNYFTEVLPEKIKLKIVLNGSSFSYVNSEITIDKGHRVDEIKYLVDELLNTNDLYTNVSIDLIYKNCILNERKTISYYKIESNEEIWIGKIEDYLREDDIILDVFISMGTPDLVHLIMKQDKTVSDVVSKMIQLFSGFHYSHIWNSHGTECEPSKTILDGESNKLLFSWDETSVGCFKTTCKIFDQYVVKKYLWKYNLKNSILMECDFELDQIKQTIKKIDHLSSLLQSKIFDDSRFNEKLSELPKSLHNSDLLFSKRMADHILDLCRDLWLSSTGNYQNLNDEKLIDYFHLGLCITLFDYLELKRINETGNTNSKRKSFEEILKFEQACLNISMNNDEKSLKDIVNDTVECLKNCQDFTKDLVILFLKRFSFYSLFEEKIENMLTTEDDFIQVKINKHDYYLKMPTDITSIRQTKKEISRAFKITPKQLYLVESGGDHQLQEEDIFQATKFINNRYIFEYIMSMDDIDILETLAQGGFGEVLLCKNKVTEETFIMKKPLDESEDLYRDISIHYQVGKSDEIVKYEGLYNYDGDICLGMEYLPGGSLKSYLEKEKCLSETEVARISYEILNQIDKFHSEGVIHRDIKPENILLDGNGHAKLVDFGLAKLTNNSCDYDMMMNLVKSSPGTLHYMAPEVSNDLVYTNKVDIWSFGVIVVEMITGKLPLGNLNPIVAANRIAKSKSIRYTLPKQVTKELKDFIESCLNPNPEERPTAKELLLYPFMQNYFDSLF